MEETASIIFYLNLETESSFHHLPVSAISRRIEQCAVHFSLVPIWPLFSPLEGYGLSSRADITHQSLPLVLKARLTFVATATSQLNPHVYLEKCQSCSSLGAQTLRGQLTVYHLSAAAKASSEQPSSWRGRLGSNGNPRTSFPYGSQDSQKLSTGRGNYFRSGNT